MKPAPFRWVGQPLPRREDERFVTGTGTYVDDLGLPARTPPGLRQRGDVLSTKAGLDATIPLDPAEQIAGCRRARIPAE